MMSRRGLFSYRLPLIFPAALLFGSGVSVLPGKVLVCLLPEGDEDAPVAEALCIAAQILPSAVRFFLKKYAVFFVFCEKNRPKPDGSSYQIQTAAGSRRSSLSYFCRLRFLRQGIAK